MPPGRPMQPSCRRSCLHPLPQPHTLSREIWALGCNGASWRFPGPDSPTRAHSTLNYIGLTVGLCRLAPKQDRIVLEVMAGTKEGGREGQGERRSQSPCSVANNNATALTHFNEKGLRGHIHRWPSSWLSPKWPKHPLARDKGVHK